jgi:protein phosphatase
LSCGNDYRWTSASRTDKGLIRERNEDACLDLPARALWAVADGMGGHAVGDFASQVVVAALEKLAWADSIESLLNDARDRLLDANRHLRAEAAARRVQRIGSTVVVLLTCGRYCGYLWAGDSRIYVFRQGHLRQLTRDHSQVEEMKARGLLTEEEAVNHPAQHLITRAVGATDTLVLDEQIEEVKDGDVFLLCSDGLTNEVTADEIARALSSGDCQVATDALVELALQRGGRDNITVVVVRADDAKGTEDRTLLNPRL